MIPIILPHPMVTPEEIKAYLDSKMGRQPYMCWDGKKYVIPWDRRSSPIILSIEPGVTTPLPSDVVKLAEAFGLRVATK